MSFTPGAGTRFLVSTGASGTTPLSGPLSITGGTVTANNPVLSATQTWNNAAVTFTGWQLNVTDTASNAASLLMDLRVGGIGRFSVRKDGQLSFNGDLVINPNDINLRATASNGVLINSTGVSIGEQSAIFFRDVPSGSIYSALRTAVSGVIEQRNGVNAQTLRVYNTFTDASNFERGALQWQSNELQLRVDGAGTGQNRPLQIVVGNQVVAYFNSAGNRSVALGAGAVAANATSGFVYVPTCAGLPTGTPETYTGRVPIVVDTTNNKLYFYSGGAWRDAGP